MSCKKLTFEEKEMAILREAVDKAEERTKKRGCFHMMPLPCHSQFGPRAAESMPDITAAGRAGMFIGAESTQGDSALPITPMTGLCRRLCLSQN